MTGDILQHLTSCGLKNGYDIMILGQGIEGQSDYNLHQMDLMIQPSIELGQQAGKQILERLERPTYPIKTSS